MTEYKPEYLSFLKSKIVLPQEGGFIVAPGELDPDNFAGLFTTIYLAIKLGRLGFGIELNHEYFTCGVKYSQDMEQQVEAPTLFDYLATLEIDKHD